MHRSFNRVGAAVALVLVGLLAIACFDGGASLEEHQARGEAYLEEEAWAEAILEFKNVVGEDPNHAAAHFGLAKAYLGQGDARRAFWELDDVVRLTPDDVDARLQHAQFLLFGTDAEVERAIESADHVLGLEPERWEALVLKARALENLDRDDEADAAYRAATEVAGDEPAPVLLYANYLRKQERIDDAEANYRLFLERSPGFAGQAALGGFLASLPDREDDAEAAYRRALETAEGEQVKAGYSLLVNFLIGRQRFDEAEQELTTAVGKVPGDRQLLYSLAQFYSAQGRVDEADAVIEKATEAAPGEVEPLLLLSTYRGFHGDLAGALDAAERAVAADPTSTLARLRRAEVLLDQGFAAEREARGSGSTLIGQGRAAVDAVLAKDETNPQALFVKAKMDIAQERPDDAVTALRQAIDAQPDWAQAHFVLASALYVKGDRRGARIEAVRALELDANLVEARRLLARIHGELGDHALAVEAGRQVLDARGGDHATRVIVAQSLVRERDFDGAIAELEAIPVDARTPESHYAIGRTLQFAGRAEESRPHLMAAYQQAPAHAEILRALLQLDVSDGKVAESEQRVAAALAEEPGDAELHLLSGEVAMLNQRAREAETAFQRALELDPNSLKAYQRLASLYVLTGRSDEVVSTYERALEKNPDSGSIHLNLALLYEVRGRVDDAIARYESAIEADPDLAVAKNNLAYLMAENGGNLDRALDLAQEAKRELPSNPNTADTLGWVLYKKDLPRAAIVHLREAVGSFPPGDPNLPIVRLHLALAYEADGQTVEALTQARTASEEAGALAKGRPEGTPEPAWRRELRTTLERLSNAT